jgi:hypothetical protein
MAETMRQIEAAPATPGKGADLHNGRLGAERKSVKALVIAAILASAGCGQVEDVSAPDLGGDALQTVEKGKTPQLMLQLNGNKFALSLYFAAEQPYDFIVTSSADPVDAVQVSSAQQKVELIEGQFINPTDGYTVEAFDMDGLPVPINMSNKPGTIYGPDQYTQR